MKAQLQIHHLEANVTVLGPGKRYAIWAQGCTRRCKGCLASDTHAMNGGCTWNVDALVEHILSTSDRDTEGITISGGEPFAQAEALSYFLKKLKQRSDFTTIVYTGYRFKDLQALSYGSELLSLVDLLIDGEYIEELNDDASLVGSSNQRVWCLTDAYRAEIDIYKQPDKRKIDYRFQSDGIFMVGVPSKTVWNFIKKTNQIK